MTGIHLCFIYSAVLFNVIKGPVPSNTYQYTSST